MTRTLGVCYYPEHWPESLWAKDAAQMKATGLTWVRIGEFAWSLMQPTPATYDWGWLDRAVETLGQAGLKVVMGTPPPPRRAGWSIRCPTCCTLTRRGVRAVSGRAATMISATWATATNVVASRGQWESAMAATRLSPHSRSTMNTTATTRRCLIPMPHATGFRTG